MLVTRIFEFAAAHKLEHKGPCKNLHGHNYKLHVTVQGEIGSDGFVIDFHDLESIVEEEVLKTLDHSYLNDMLEQPSAENIAVWVWERLKGKLELNKIKIFETDDCYVEYLGP